MKIKQLYALFFAFLHLCPVLTAQPDAGKYWQTWNNSSLHDTARLNALQYLSYSYVHHNPDSARMLAEVQLAFSRERNLPEWQARALNYIGLSFRFQSDYAKALQHYRQSIALFEKTGDRSDLAAVYGNMGDIYRLQSNFPKAIECIARSLSLAEEAGDFKQAADAYVSIATIYFEEPGNDDKILEYLEKARVLYGNLKNERGLSFVYGNLSAVYLNRKDYDKALFYIEKSLAVQEKTGDEHGAATSLHNRAVIHSEQGRFREALADFNREIGIFRRMGDLEGLADAQNGVGDIRIRQGNYPAAIRVCGEALQIARTMGSPNFREVDACTCLYNAYRKQGNFKQALVYLERSVAAKDSLSRNETAQKLKQMEIERQMAADSLERVKETFQVEMNHQQALRRKDNAFGLLLLAGLALLTVALAFWVRMLYFQRRSQQLQARSDELSRQQLLHEITLLRMQVNPHFLFNSLNILSSLVHVDAKLSERFIEQLSYSYRYILEQKEQSLVTLRTELEFIKSYAFLLKIRFENKFELDLNLADEILDICKIPPLTLQLLIENAVKHNRMSVKEPLTVFISAENDQTMVVKNRLQARAGAVVSTGVGLQNIVNRYALLTDRRVWAGEEEGVFVVKVPLLT